MADLRVLLVADDPLARAGLATLLAGEDDVEIVMQLASDDEGLAEALDAFRADVVLWDLGWEITEDFDRLADLVEVGRPVVVLAPAPDLVRAIWAAGARGLIARDAGGKQMVAALSAASQGLVVVDPQMAAGLPLPFAASTDDRIVETLTPRELDVLQLLAEGAANKSIARQLAISEHTVKYHVNAILGKLGAQSRTEAVVRDAGGVDFVVGR